VLVLCSFPSFAANVIFSAEVIVRSLKLMVAVMPSPSHDLFFACSTAWSRLIAKGTSSLIIRGEMKLSRQLKTMFLSRMLKNLIHTGRLFLTLYLPTR